jgi:hypothetical protein
MRARGCLFGVLGIAVGLSMVGDAVDIGARHVATSRIEQRISVAVPESSGAHAWIHSFPFLQVVVNGNVDEVGARVARVVERPLVFTDVVVDLHHVRISVSDLLSNGRVVVTRIGLGTITLDITEASLEQALPGFRQVAPLLIGRVVISVDAAARRLRFEAPGRPAVTLPLPGTNLLPCLPAVAQSGGDIRLSCTFTKVPAAFTTAAGG